MTVRFYSLLLAMLILIWPLASSGQGKKPDLTLDSIDIELSQEAREAIDAGVVLTFDCEFAILQRWWIFSQKKKNKIHRFTLTRHKLSNRYIVQSGDQDTPHIFRSITKASDYIAAQARLLLESYSDDQVPYSMRISLNKFELPTPMRLRAFIADAWDLDSGWITWVYEK